MAKLLKIKDALFSSYIEEYIDFVPFSGAWGDMTAFRPFGSAFEGQGSPPPVNSICVYFLNLKDDACTDYFQKVHANYPLHRRIISQVQTIRSGVGVEAV